MTDMWPGSATNQTRRALFSLGTPANISLTKNVDLREGLRRILFGDTGNPPEGHYVVIRRMVNVCPCVEEEVGQAYRKPDPKCSVCKGEGYTYTDSLNTAWRAPIMAYSQNMGTMEYGNPGIAKNMGFAFYFQHDVSINEKDKIFETNLSTEGALPTVPLTPANFLEKYRIIQIINYRADNGRLEFKQVIVDREEW